MDMNKSNITTLKINQDERGVLLPYILFIMVIISSFIVTSYDKIAFNIEQEQLIEEQRVIQNIIELSIYDFITVKDELDISSTPSHITFSYKHGYSTVAYYFITETEIQLSIRAISNEGMSHNFRTLLSA